MSGEYNVFLRRAEDNRKAAERIRKMITSYMSCEPWVWGAGDGEALVRAAQALDDSVRKCEEIA